MPPTPPALGAPLVAGVIHGVRTWSVGPHQLLQGAGNGAVLAWSPDGEPTSAHCLADTHPAPDPGCGCGLYAYHPHSRSLRRLRRAQLEAVTGVVEAWGRVELHRGGFRAKYARPVALFVAPEHLIGLERRQRIETLAERYCVPLVELPTPAMAAEWCAREGLGLERGVVSGLLRGLAAGEMEVGCE